MPPVLEPEVRQADLEGRLAALRRRLRRIALSAGALHLLAGVLIIVVVFSGLDRLIDLPSSLRAVGLVAMLVGTGLAFRRWVVTPWRDAGRPLALARLVESRVGGLHDTLASVVDDCEGSESLLSATRLFAIRRTRGIDFRDFADDRPVYRGVGWATAAILAGLAIGPGTTGLARLFDPYGEHAWPTRTQIRVTAPTSIARGTPFPLQVQLAGQTPERVVLEVQLQGAAAVELPYAVDGPEIRLQLEPSRVPRGFDWRLTAGDASTGWRSTTVTVPPEFVAIDGRPSPHGRLVPPRYTGIAPSDLADGAGGCEAVLGSVVSLTALVDRPIVSARLEFRPTDPKLLAGLASLCLGETTGLGAIGNVGALAGLTTPIAVRLDGESRRLAVEVTPILSGNWDWVMVDAAGLTGRRPFDFRVLPDPSPAVTLVQPSASGAGIEMVVDAAFRVQALIEDRQFAARRVAIEHRNRPTEQPRELSLYDGAALGASLRRLLVPIGTDGATLRPTELSIDRRIRVADLKRSDGKPPTVGDTVILCVIADDFDDVTPTKPPGRSVEVELRIIGRDRLEANLARARATIAKELDELRAIQAAARDLAAPVDLERRRTGELSPADRERLARSEGLQLQLRDRLGDEREGVRGQMARYQQTLADNPGPSAADRGRADRLASELNRIATELLEPLPGLISAARSEVAPASPAERGSGPLPEVVRRQNESVDRLRALSELAQAGQELAGLTAEAGAMATAQDQLSRQRATAATTIPPGADPAKLANSDRETLGRMREDQQQLADRAAELERKIASRAAAAAEAAREQRQKARQIEDAADGENSPKKAGELRREQSRAQDRAEALEAEAAALADAKQAMQSGRPLADTMKQAAESLAANRLGEAEKNQTEAARVLEELRAALRDAERPTEGERLLKERQRAEQAVGELTRAQEQLQDRTLAAEQTADLLSKEQQLKELAREQQELAERAEEQARQLRREQQEDAARALERAAREMTRAQEQLAQGKPAASQQDDALEKLDDAADQTARDRRKTEENLRREQLVKLGDRLKGLQSRQAAMATEADRLFATAESNRAWSRSLLRSLADLGAAQSTLAKETATVAEKQLEAYPVMRRLAQEAADALNEVATAIEEMRAEGPAPDRVAEDRGTVKVPQDRAQKRISQLLAALEPAQEEKATAAASPAGRSEQPGGGAAAPEGDPIPPTAQLKLLRDLQQELLDRTAALAKLPSDPARWTPAQKREFDRVRREQAELAALFAELSAQMTGEKP